MPTRWPDWWTWELNLENPHLAKRMLDRGFNEIDIREMMGSATSYEDDPTPGRYRVRTTHDRREWRVVVEPLEDEERLLVVTAFPED